MAINKISIETLIPQLKQWSTHRYIFSNKQKYPFANISHKVNDNIIRKENSLTRLMWKVDTTNKVYPRVDKFIRLAVKTNNLL